jgi:hypothetical protein
MTKVIEPELVIESNGIHRQRVFIPSAGGMPIPDGIRISGVFAVHEEN